MKEEREESVGQLAICTSYLQVHGLAEGMLEKLDLEDEGKPLCKLFGNVFSTSRSANPCITFVMAVDKVMRQPNGPVDNL